jgi:NAD(P)H-nitrite reductase large subunit
MSLEDDPERTICFCHCVSYAEIVQAIRDGSRTVADIQAQLRASTGCGGCECDVQEILEAELAKLAVEPAKD